MLPWIPAKPVKHFEESLSYIIAALVVEGFQSLSLTIEASQFEWKRDGRGGRVCFPKRKRGEIMISRVEFRLEYVSYK